MRRSLLALCLLAGFAGTAQARGAAPEFEMPGLVNALATTQVAQIQSKDARVQASRSIYFAAFAVALDERWAALPASAVAITRGNLSRLQQDGVANPALTSEEVRDIAETARRDAAKFTEANPTTSPAARNAVAQLGRLVNAAYPARQSPSSQLRDRRIEVRMSPTWE